MNLARTIALYGGSFDPLHVAHGPSVTHDVRPVGSGRLNVYSTRLSASRVSRSALTSGRSR